MILQILNHDRRGLRPASRPGRFSPAIHCTLVRVGSRTGLDAMATGETFATARNQTPVIQPVP